MFKLHFAETQVILLYSPQVFYIFRHFMWLIFLQDLCAEGFRNPA